MNKRMAIAFSFAFAITGCARVSVTETFGQNGDHAYALNCRNPSDCMEKAGSLCGSNGYTVESSDTSAGSAAFGNSNGIYGASSTRKSMLISCKQKNYDR